jgi:hypothetical protein
LLVFCFGPWSALHTEQTADIRTGFAKPDVVVVVVVLYAMLDLPTTAVWMTYTSS